MPEFICVKCCSCHTAQSIQRPKSRKYSCRLCQQKQSVKHVYAISYDARDIRAVVMQLNMRQQQDEQIAADDDEEDDSGGEERDDEEQRYDGDDYRAAGAHGTSGAAPQAARPPPTDWSAFLQEEEEREEAHRPYAPVHPQPNSASFVVAQSSAAAISQASSRRAPKRTRARNPLRSLDSTQAAAAPTAAHSSYPDPFHSSTAAAVAAAADSAESYASPAISADPVAAATAAVSFSDRWSVFFDDEDSGGLECAQPPAKQQRTDGAATAFTVAQPAARSQPPLQAPQYRPPQQNFFHTARPTPPLQAATSQLPFPRQPPAPPQPRSPPQPSSPYQTATHASTALPPLSFCLSDTSSTRASPARAPSHSPSFASKDAAAVPQSRPVANRWAVFAADDDD